MTATRSYPKDKKFEDNCVEIYHPYACRLLAPSDITLSRPESGVFAFDAELRLRGKPIRIEYKFDRYQFLRMCYEIISKDRGDGAAVGYGLQNAYDWLVYVFTGSGYVLVLEANALREYVFTHWHKVQMFTSHCANSNVDSTCSWSLFPRVEDVLRALLPRGLAFVTRLPKDLFHSVEPPKEKALEIDVREVELARLVESNSTPIQRIFHELFTVPTPELWTPSFTEHWLAPRNVRRYGGIHVHGEREALGLNQNQGYRSSVARLGTDGVGS